ncbi:MAG: amidohydrolase family protein [Planctomycetota bacterium]|jgi:predicted TIM-barrel fold metal-dependent hydrolase
MPGRIIDFHTHAFPDALAEHAMARLGSETDEVHPNLDGKVSSLVASMDAEGIEMAVLCSIATKPSQFDPIFRWSQEIASDRIIPLASVHPKDPDAVKHIHQVAKAGLKGLKMHPYYQDFYLDDPQLYPLFEAIQSEGLKQISDVIARFPEMKLITTHLGAWQQWDEVRRYLLGKPVYMETSFSIEYLGVDQVRRMLLEHSPDHILFGTDSPWTDQRKTFESHKKMDLPSGIESKYFYYNALRVLGMG